MTSCDRIAARADETYGRDNLPSHPFLHRLAPSPPTRLKKRSADFPSTFQRLERRVGSGPSRSGPRARERTCSATPFQRNEQLQWTLGQPELETRGSGKPDSGTAGLAWAPTAATTAAAAADRLHPVHGREQSVANPAAGPGAAGAAETGCSAAREAGESGRETAGPEHFVGHLPECGDDRRQHACHRPWSPGLGLTDVPFLSSLL